MVKAQDTIPIILSQQNTFSQQQENKNLSPEPAALRNSQASSLKSTQQQFKKPPELSGEFE